MNRPRSNSYLNQNVMANASETEGDEMEIPEGKFRCGACNVILSHDEWVAHKDTTEHLNNAGMAYREVIDQCETKMDEIEGSINVRR